MASIVHLKIKRDSWSFLSIFFFLDLQGQLSLSVRVGGTLGSLVIRDMFFKMKFFVHC